MKCFNCGAEAPAGNKFCPRCGASMSVGPAGGAGAPQAAKGNNHAGQVNPGNVNPGNVPPGYQNPGQVNQGYPNAGYPNPGYPGGGYPVQGGSSATASMILGIVSIALAIIGAFIADSARKTALGVTLYVDQNTAGMGGLLMGLAMITSIVGFILGIYAIKKKTPRRGRAIAGLVCNGIFVIPMLLGILIFIFILLFD